MTEPERPGPELRAFRVHGRVQGVGFRWWTRRLGVGLGLFGDVCNLPTGVVEVQVGGPADKLDEFERVLFAGPPMSRVAEVERIVADDDMPRDGFYIESR
jgi:acylphosphatase